MTIQIIPDRSGLTENIFVSQVISYLEENHKELFLGNCFIFYDFPILTDEENTLLRAKMLLISENKGLTLFGSSAARKKDQEALTHDDDTLDKLYSLLYSKIIKYRDLRQDRKSLIFDFETILYAPNYEGSIEGIQSELIKSFSELNEIFKGLKNKISSKSIHKTISIIDGSIVLPRQNPRENVSEGSKGYLVNKLEEEISTFDNKQRHGYMQHGKGVQRIRGLAGSGKTVILALKAALAHLENPNATILFTFYTKSLYQQVKRLITRFYRHFSDGRDPDIENRIHILHGWGGEVINGAYHQACIDNDISPMKFSQAYGRGRDPFDVVCTQFLDLCPTPIEKYDFAFIDEGQDFPTSFVNLIAKSTKEQKVVWAYDELQSIFSNTIPTGSDIFGGIASDVILYKCYRNPREILVCAHALGFGIYSDVVQMLETEERWTSAGYSIISGELTAGSSVVIERPEDNTLKSLSKAQTIDQIIKAKSFDDFDKEIEFCAQKIKEDIEQGLRPDDILVVVIDDRNAKTYLNAIASELRELKIPSNNIHADVYDLVDFVKEGKVTLSTLSKAKGNEAYSVYILGIDSVMIISTKKNRNKIFTALTRSKGWVTITGMGQSANKFIKELAIAKKHFPRLEFTYPSEDDLEIIPDDMTHANMNKVKEEQAFDHLLETLGEDKFKELFMKKFTPSKKR